MATIALYVSKVNQMPKLIKDVKKQVTDYNFELSKLRTQALTINKSICNLDDVVNSIQASSKIQEEKIESLEKFQSDSEEFIEDVVKIDDRAADTINKRKNDFYDRYYYLKPECEKSKWEKFKDKFKKIVDWIKEHWQSIGKIALTVLIVATIGVASVLTGGVVAVILTGAFIGALSGALISGIVGGVTSLRGGGSFIDGLADGALEGGIAGAVTGAIFAGIGVAGSAFGTFLGGACKFAQSATKILRILECTSKITGVLSIGMGAFDTLSLTVGLFNPDSPFVKFNEKLHSNSLYNALQIGISIAAVFSAGAYGGMMNRMQQGPPACFVAGTMILTALGLVAIENIKIGDKVLSMNPTNLEKSEKLVLETYRREVPKLVHLTVKDEQISTTIDHPFYISGRGFVNAGELKVGDMVLTASRERFSIERIRIEVLEKLEVVYNFQVEDFHTYFVGKHSLWVHNECYLPTADSPGFVSRVDHPDGSVTITKMINGESISITYTKAANGNLYPRFERYAHPMYSSAVEVRGMNGAYGHDARLANMQLGLRATPEGYTWHHLESGTHMILVRTDIHSIRSGGFSHMGGASIIRNR